MSTLRKFPQLLFTTAFMIFLLYLHKLKPNDLASAGFGAKIHNGYTSGNLSTLTSDRGVPVHRKSGQLSTSMVSFPPKFDFGTPKPPGSNYTRILVVPRLKDDNVSWIEDELSEIDTAIYVADDPNAALHPPMNKGHEVTIYLTYIIDHYFELPDTVIFMHAHRWTHHNLELLGFDSAEMVRRLRNEYVAHEGYVNMRCRWYPGCPEWLHPGNNHEALAKQEAVVLSKCWRELFPSETLPGSLGQGCCAQFAVSKNRVLSIPRSRFVFYRDWILRTPLSDYVSGRIWEYLWQFLFTGKTIYCPSEHACHCLGFGICFGGDAQYKEFDAMRRKKEAYEVELHEIQEQRHTADSGKESGDAPFNLQDVLDWGRYSNLTNQIEALEKEMKARRQGAIEQGGIFDNRAEISLKQWSQRKDF